MTELHEHMRAYREQTAETDERRLHDSRARQCEAEEERELRQAQYHFSVFRVCAERARGWRDKAQELRLRAKGER